MITHEIKKGVGTTPNLFRDVKERIVNITRGRSVPASSSGQSDQARYMGKLEYAQWVENIKKEFKVGEYATFSSMHYTPDRIPAPVFKIVGIQEIHWNAPKGYAYDEPRAIEVVSLIVPDIVVTYEPRSLRKLNQEELKLVHLRDHNNKANKDGNPQAAVCSFDRQRQAFVLLDADGNLIRELD